MSMQGRIINYTEISFNCDEATFKKIEEVFKETRLERLNYYDLCIDYSEEDHAGIVTVQDSEVGNDWDIQLEDFDVLLMTYDTHLEGYYIEDIVSDIVRVDILRSVEAEGHTELQTRSNGLMWLADYTAEQIQAIHEAAKEMFPEQPAERSDSYGE